MMAQAHLPNSGKLRSQIGRVRSLIIGYNERYNTILDSQAKNIESMTVSELTDLSGEMESLREKLLNAFGTLQKLHIEWDHLIKIYPQEKEIYTNYVQQYGEYVSYFDMIPKIIKEMDLNIEKINRRTGELGHSTTTNNVVDYTVVHPQLSGNPVQGLPPGNAPNVGNHNQSPLSPQNMGNHDLRTGTSPLPGGNPAQKLVHHNDVVVHPNGRDHLAFHDDDTLRDLIDPFARMDLVNQQRGFHLQAEAKLPKIDITPFDGDRTLWSEFFEQFVELIHSKSNIGKITKFTYLRNLLRGKARMMIAGLPLSEKNYDIALETLKSFYGGTKGIATRLRNELMNLPQCTQMDSQFVDLYYNIMRIYRQLTQLDLKPDNYDMAHAIEKKLPKKVIQKLYSGCRNNKNLSTTEILDKLEGMVHEILLIDEITEPPKSESKHHTMYTSRGFNRDKCHLCYSTEHRAKDCHHYPTADDKYHRVRRLRLCRRCLGNHHTSECRSRENCSYCGYSHHSILCKKSDQERSRKDRRLDRSPTPFSNHYSRTQQHRSRFDSREGRSPSRQYRSDSYGRGTGNNSRKYSDSRDRRNDSRDSRDRRTDSRGRSDSRDSHSNIKYQRSDSRDSKRQFNSPSDSQHRSRKDFHERKSSVRFEQHKYKGGKKGSQENSRERQERVNFVDVQSSSDEDSGDDDHSKHYIYSIKSNVKKNNSVLNDQSFSSEVLLMCLPLNIMSSDGSYLTTTAIVDPGSSGDFISSSLVKRLGIPPIVEEELHLDTFGTECTKVVLSERFLIDIKLNNNKTMSIEMNSLVVMTSPLKVVQLSEADLAYTRDQPVLDLPMCKQKPDILLSTATYASLLTPDSPLEFLPSGFVVQHSLVGPILFGKGKIDRDCLRTIKIINQIEGKTDKIEDCLTKLWETEAIGICDEPTACEDDESLQYFEKTIRKGDNGRYIVKLHWRDGMRVGENYDQSYSRLCSAFKTLNKNSVMEKYHEIIMDQLKKNVIEEVIDGQRDGEDGKVTYIPHHPVITPQKTTTKTRIVYDASSKTESGNSLNQCLFRGPVILPEIGAILLRCRQPPILISSDIEKAFLQIELDVPDRDAARFLWLRDPTKPPTRENVVTYRFRRVPFGIISSPFHLSATIRHHLIQMNHPLLQGVHDNSYVDNIFLFCNTSEEAENLYFLSKQAFAEGTMNLREYASNDERFNEFVVSQGEDKVPSEVKILGLKWNLENDTFSTSTIKPPDEKVWTKRKTLKYTAKPFDPIGMLVPILILLKMFLQGLWKKKYRWDEALDTNDDKELRKILSTMRQMTMSIPRRLFTRTDHDTRCELHTFVDASGKAFGCVSYLRVFTPSMGYSVRFLFAKARLVPISGISIPKAELLAIEIGSRIQKYIRESLKDIKFARSIIWSDSKVALMWTLSDTTTNVFVRNRCKKINDTVRKYENTSLFYISTDQNPADIASRGCTVDELEEYKPWLEGPDFLRLNDNEWNEKFQISAIALKEKEKRPDQNLSVFSTQKNIDDDNEKDETLYSSSFVVPFDNYSSYYKIVGIVARLIYFFKFTCTPFFRKITGITGDLPSHFAEVQVVLMKLAERIIIRRIQCECPPSQSLSKIVKFFVDATGLIRVESRLPLLQSDSMATVRHPIYLPHTHYVTKLIIMYVHNTTLHSSPLHVLSTLRHHYWFVKGRAVVKNVIKELCFACKRITAKPFRLPLMKALPPERVFTQVSPFTNIGIDYAGPFTIKGDKGTLEKVWVILATCLSVRAIHCEYVKNLSTQTFLNFLRRFISRKGQVQYIFCDNQSTFVASEKVVSEIHKKSLQLNEFCKDKGIQFKFITALSPWKGGVYERMIGLLKRCLKTAIGRRLVTEDEFHTFLYESEAVVNGRPLTYVSGDLNELTPIRPVDFLVPLSSTDTLRFDEYDDDYVANRSLTSDLITLWKEQTRRLDFFWKMFYNEYLNELLYSSKNVHKQGKHLNVNTPKKGDVVIVRQENPNRSHWELARIIDLPDTAYPSSATMRCANGNILDRPVSMLHFLESSDWDTKDQKMCDNRQKRRETSSDQSENIHPMTTRSKRSRSLVNLAHLSRYALIRSDGISQFNRPIPYGYD